MNSISAMRNVGAYLKTLPAFAAATFTANSPATGTDGVPQNGKTIDRNDLVENALSGLFAFILTTASIQGGASVTIEVTFEDSDDGQTWAAFGAAQVPAALAITGDAEYVYEAPLDIGGARRYIRCKVECTFSATGTDTAVVAGVFVAAGGENRPMSYSGTVSE